MKKLFQDFIDNIRKVIFINANKTKQINPYFFEDLTPYDDVKDTQYIEALRWAIKNRKIKNIALTGLLGSGKSSIIKTFQNKHKEFNYLNLSLASFLIPKKTADDKISTPSDKENLNRLIEQSILQQIFYGVKSKNIPDSRFKRINRLSLRKLFSRSIFIIIWLFSVLYLSIPDLLDSFLPFSISVLQENDIYGFISFGIILTGLILFINRIYRLLNNAKFKKLNIKTGEIELDEKINTSILNKHLDEILYFFKATSYNVVVIEDLDRFNNIDIFTKLREINLLLNESNEISRDINFIYAIKDDVFTNDKIRTKFFDFIIPVIPVVSSTNSQEIFIKKFKNAGIHKIVSNSLIEDIAWYIDDMRVLKNIYNEFIIYKGKLDKVGLNFDKLFSIIVYKNLYPNDFSNLQYNKGMIYDAFENKHILKETLLKKKNKEIEATDNLIDKIEKETFNIIEDLRNLYTGHIAKKLSHLVHFGIYMDGKRYSFNDLEEDDAFNLLQKQENIHMLNQQNVSSRRQTGFSFKDIEKEVDDKTTYNEREKIVKQKFDSKINKVKENRENLVKERMNIVYLDLKDLLENIDINEALGETISKEKLLVYLLRNGYIDEMYQSYISYFYEGTITKKDKDFILSVKDRVHLGYDYKLNKIESILKNLHLHEFGRKEVLNFDLFEYLLRNQNEYREELNQVFKKLSDESDYSIDFIESYSEKSKYVDKFYYLLCKEWIDIWRFVNINDQFSDNKKDSYLKNILKYADNEDLDKINKRSDNTFKIFIENTAHFIQLFQNDSDYIDKVKQAILKLDVKFKNLKRQKDLYKFYEYINENELYAINENNISLFINIMSHKNFTSEKLLTANYTSIKESDCKNLIKYINRNINLYLVNVFLKLDTNTKESEQSIIELLNNTEITEENKEKIINKEETLITDIKKIPEELGQTLVDNYKMYPNWNNVISYYKSKDEIDEFLICFFNIESNYKELSKVKLNKAQEISEELSKEISKKIVLNPEIKEESFSYLINSIPYRYYKLSFEELSRKKVEVMISSRFLIFTKDNFELLKESFDNLHIKFIEEYLNAFIKEMNEFEIDENDLLQIFNSERITKRKKRELVKLFDFDNIEMTKDLANKIINILLPHPSPRVGKDLLLKIIKYGNLTSDRIKLLNLHIARLNENEITICLKSLPYKYSSITINGRPNLTKNDHNKKLVEKLDKLGYISSYKIKKNTIQVFTFG